MPEICGRMRFGDQARRRTAATRWRAAAVAATARSVNLDFHNVRPSRLPHPGNVRSPPEADVVTDPLPVDAAFDPLRTCGNTGFTSGYTYSPGNLYDAGVYDVSNNPYPENNYWASFGPHSGSLMMIVNGADIPNVTVWSETGITVTPDTNY